MNKTALVIMAAGMGSRYGGGIKQLEKVGPSGEIIMDYSIHDAKAAGFDRVVFITRRDLEKDFREIIGNRVEKKIETDLSAYQDTPENVLEVLKGCSLMGYLCNKAAKTGYLTHFERLSVLYVFGHLVEDGKQFVHTVMAYTLNYQYNTT